MVVMDYDKNDLRSILINAQKIGLTEDHVTAIMYNMLSAVELLHSTGCMHRDIKPANFLIADDCQVTLCDFGFTRPTVSLSNKPD